MYVINCTSKNEKLFEVKFVLHKPQLPMELSWQEATKELQSYMARPYYCAGALLLAYAV